MSGESEDGEGMKPVDSGEGEKRDAADQDAPPADGFTILDAEPDENTSTNDNGSPHDRESSEDNEPLDASESENDSAAPEDDKSTGDDQPSAGTEDADSTESAAVDTDAPANAEPADSDNDPDTGELSFDEWLAEAEIPTDDAEVPAAPTPPGKGRKNKIRRPRRSRSKRNADASDGEKKKVVAAVKGPDKNGASDMVGEGEAGAEGEESNGGDEITGTSMSEIMAELLAAAEQSSLEHDGEEQEEDTEPELGPEATSEFVSAADTQADTAADDEDGADHAESDDEADKADSDEQAGADTVASETAKDQKQKDDETSAQESQDENLSKDNASKDNASKDNASKDNASKDSASKDSASSDGKLGAEESEDKEPKDDTSGDNKPSDEKSEAGDSEKSEPKDPTSADVENKTDGEPATDDNTVNAAAVQSQVESKTAGPTITPLPRPERSSPIPTVALAALAVVVGLYAILLIGWAIDSFTHRGEAMRGVKMANIAVGGSDEEALGEVLDTLDADLEARDLEVTVDDVEIDTDPFSLGVRHDRTPMIEEALDARRGGFIALRPIRWLTHLFSSENIPASYNIDMELAASGTDEIISPELSLPIEPTMELKGSNMAVVNGATGVAVDPEEIVDQLPDIVDGPAPYQISLTALTADPVLTDEAVAEVVDDINAQTEQPILAQVLDKEVEVSPRMLKSWMVLEADDGEASWSIDEDLALEDLKPLFPTLGSEDQQARFSVVDDEPIIIPASETVICCEAGTLSTLSTTIGRNIPAPIDPPEGSPEDAEPTQPLRRARLEPAITGQDEGVAELEKLGIIEEVSTFTTPHACCQNRVINIQRFADLMQGVVIRPGEEFSLNEFVGRRTRENGFVADGAIVLGNFEPQVGGGISQYATTFFNASFFAGIEFLEYQSHSIYISRYPRGREATISWRRPDLKVLNNTDYGILVWNEYTDTSITVTFYSTKNREVEALDLKRSSDRQCRIDITPRVITFEDGTTEEDSVRAIYRPGQGLDCNGNSTTPEEDEPKPANNVTPPAPDPEPDPEPEPEPEPEPDDGDILPPGE